MQLRISFNPKSSLNFLKVSNLIIIFLENATNIMHSESVKSKLMPQRPNWQLNTFLGNCDRNIEDNFLTISWPMLIWRRLLKDGIDNVKVVDDVRGTTVHGTRFFGQIWFYDVLKVSNRKFEWDQHDLSLFPFKDLPTNFHDTTQLRTHLIYKKQLKHKIATCIDLLHITSTGENPILNNLTRTSIHIKMISWMENVT